MRYHEHAVPAPLGDVVETIWTLEAAPGDMGDGDQPVVPDGRAEIILHFGDRFDRVDDGIASPQSATIVAGQLSAPLVLRPTGRIAVLGVRLKPMGAAALVPVPQHELLDQTLDAAEVSRPIAAWLAELRETAGSLDDAAARVGDGLVPIVNRGRLDPRVGHASDLIDAAAGRVTVDALARRVNLTPRQLERLFRDRVGLSPKPLMRIRRLQQALRLLEDAGTLRPAAIAAAAGGYADQAHFVRECRALAGYTPGAHVLRRAELTGLFLDRPTDVARVRSNHESARLRGA